MKEVNSELQKELEKIKEDLEAEQQKSQEYLNGWKRAKADYLNLERNTSEEKSHWSKMIRREIFSSFLSILDSFDQLISHLPPELAENEWAQGVLHLKKQLEQILKQFHISKIKSLGEKFDPLKHEAVKKEGDGDQVISEISSGYLIQEELLRPAKVIVGKKIEKTDQK